MNPQTPANEVASPLSLPEVVLRQQQEVARLKEENQNLRGTILAIIKNRREWAKMQIESASLLDQMLNGLVPALEEPNK